MMIPVLESDELEVVAFTLDAEPDVIHALGDCLNEAEWQRAAELRLERDRRRFIATRGQLRHVLASRIGIAPSEIDLKYGRLGKPFLSPRTPGRALHFSVSRSEDVAVIALSATREVGVDIEALRPLPEADDIAALCFSAPEQELYRNLVPEERLVAFFRSWTRLEAVSKALGCGLGSEINPDERDFTITAIAPKPGYVGTVVVRN